MNGGCWGILDLIGSWDNMCRASWASQRELSMLCSMIPTEAAYDCGCREA